MADVDRSHLPIRRPSFSGVVNRTLAGSQPDWNLIGHPTPPEGAPNVLLVLIDDAGFGNPSTFGGPDPDAELHPDGRGRHPLQPLPCHGHLLARRGRPCSPAATATPSASAPSASSPAAIRATRRRCRATPRRCPRILRDNGYSTAAFGKWHLTPDGQQGPAGPFDRWPNGWGFEYFYGFLGGGAGQWDTVIAENQKIIGVDPTYGDETDPYYLPDAMADKTIEWLHGDPGTGRPEAVLRLLLDGLQPRAAPCRRVLGGQVQGQVRPGLGPTARGDVRAPEGARRRPAGCGADAAQRGVPRLGRRAGQAQAVLRPPDGGLRRLLRERRPQRRPGHRCHRRAGRARQHAGHLDLGRQRREHGGHGHRLVQRADDAERHPADRRDAAPAVRAVRRHGCMGCRDHGAPLRRGLGVGRQHALPVGQAGGLAPRRHAQPDGHPLARIRPVRAAGSGRSSPTSSTSRRRSSTSPASRRRRPSTASSSSRCTGSRSRTA